VSSDGQATIKSSDAAVIAEIHESNEWLARKLDTDGPYDGVIAFSQGATLVSGYLLYQQWYASRTPPFRFAIFISGRIPLEVLKDLGVPVSKDAERVVKEVQLRCQAGLGPLPSHTSLERQAIYNSDDCFGLNLNKVPLELKIRIPTVHVWGRNDAAFPTSIQLASLCDPYLRKIYTHSDGHGVPQEIEDTGQLGQLLSWCMQRAIWPGHLQI
jgi:pimeloyl-ACP methyl ester carboxylesterase